MFLWNKQNQAARRVGGVRPEGSLLHPPRPHSLPSTAGLHCPHGDLQSNWGSVGTHTVESV